MKYLMIAILSIALSGCASKGLFSTESQIEREIREAAIACDRDKLKDFNSRNRERDISFTCNYKVIMELRPPSPQLYNQQ